MSTQSSDTPAVLRLAAWCSFALAGAGIFMIILRSPFSSGAIASIAAIFLGGYAIRKGLKNNAPSQLGLNLGLFNLLLWFVLFILLERLLGIDLSTIFNTGGG